MEQIQITYSDGTTERLPSRFGRYHIPDNGQVIYTFAGPNMSSPRGPSFVLRNVRKVEFVTVEDGQ